MCASDRDRDSGQPHHETSPTVAHTRELMEWLGHSTVQVCLDRYGHRFPVLGEGLDQRHAEASARAVAGR